MVVLNIVKKQEFETIIKDSKLVVVHFYAEWAEQCKQMNSVMDELAVQSEFKNVKFARLLAEELPEVSIRYNVSAVPTLILLREGQPVDRVDGANPAELTAKVKAHAAKLPFLSTNDSQPNDLTARLKTLTTSAPVMLFMKGSPAEPRCGFSSEITNLLNSVGILYKTFDILTDPQVREGLKTYSDWPTFPQLYINGELVGGLDIVKELHATGALQSKLSKTQILEHRLKALTLQSDVMVFMKGNKDNPRCKFSRELMDILKDTRVKFGSFDILEDEEVRQGLKTYSKWPTFPQVYVKGEMIGGLDIIKELKDSGELLKALNPKP